MLPYYCSLPKLDPGDLALPAGPLQDVQGSFCKRPSDLGSFAVGAFCQTPSHEPALSWF
jgi:hypothetical protein